MSQDTRAHNKAKIYKCVHSEGMGVLHVCVCFLASGYEQQWGEAVGTGPLDPLHALMGVHLVWIPGKAFPASALLVINRSRQWKAAPVTAWLTEALSSGLWAVSPTAPL